MQVHLLLAHILGKLTAKPGDGSQGNRVPLPRRGSRQEASWFFHWPKSSLHSCLEECLPDMVVPEYPFTPDAAGDCAVAQDV